MLAAVLLAAGCTSAPIADEADLAESTLEPAPAITAGPTVAPPPTSEPTPTGEIVVPTAPVGRGGERPDIASALDVEPAPLGTYVVARPEAGILVDTPPVGKVTPQLEIPVYEVPFGPPRTLLDVNAVLGVNQRYPLLNWSSVGGALVLRVVAGGPDDDWLLVQAPVRSHDRTIWVRRADFDFGFTTMRVEIDLADEGWLRVVDVVDGVETTVLESPIVQGREHRPTPSHLTYIEGGIEGRVASPAYGSFRLAMASFSQVLGTFGNGIPRNFLHGTNRPELVGQRVSSRSIRVPNDVIEDIVAAVTPGTPVLLFDDSSAPTGREEVLGREPQNAATVAFADHSAGAVDGVGLLFPQLWTHCGAGASALLCRTP